MVEHVKQSLECSIDRLVDPKELGIERGGERGQRNIYGECTNSICKESPTLRGGSSSERLA